MNVLYIGEYGYGSTCSMRGEALKKVLENSDFKLVDVSQSLKNHSRLFRSLGWRYQIGPLVNSINNSITNKLDRTYDLIWVDKGMFITPRTIQIMRKKAGVLLHYTPDMAFYSNHSRFFTHSLPVYDCCVTTKRAELDLYRKFGAKNIVFTTQGFDNDIHRSYHTFEQKSGIVFIGLHEPFREKIIEALLDASLPVKLGGVNWGKVVKRHKNNLNLEFLGESLFAESYARAISGACVGLGLLSKRFNELHTTRTFEIPACGTALATERNQETEKFYIEQEAIFFNDIEEAIDEIKQKLYNKFELEKITNLGTLKVRSGGYDYQSIVSNILHNVN